MQTYTLTELVQELERQKQTKWDRVANATRLQFTADENGVYMRIPDLNGVPTDMPLTDWAHSQVSTKLGVPAKYYRRMLEEQEFDLLAHNCNIWMEKKYTTKQCLIRTLDGYVRGFLSDRYFYLENEQVMWLALKRLSEYNAHVHESAITDRMMYIKATTPYTEYEVVHDDKVVPGIIIRNSEVGASRLLIQPLLIRKICDNGLIGAHKFGRIHLGGRRNEGVINWSEKTRKIESELVKSQIIDAIDQAFNEEIIEEWMEAIRKGTEFKIDDRVAAAEAVQINLGLTEAEKRELLNNFAEEKPNVWGLANGITRTAKEAANYDRRVELEELANELILTPPEQLTKWLEEAKEAVKE